MSKREMIFYFLGLGIGIVCMVIALPIQAGTNMRCDRGIVSTGNDQFEVIYKCGTPNASFTSKSGFGPTVEVWQYSGKRGQFSYTLKFKNEMLVSITKRVYR